MDFDGAPDDARRGINSWVAERTEQRISELLPEGSIKVDTRVVLTNAVYFLGKWLLQFDRTLTQEKDFLVNPEITKPVPMMQVSSAFNYAALPGVDLLELPYTGEDLSMVLLLPSNPNGLQALERLMTAQVVGEWLGKLAKRNVKVYLPRFELRYKTKLKKPLVQMGMKLPFTSAADFSGITGNTELLIDDAYHEALIKADEEGTEAAAATAVMTRPKSVRASNTLQFVVDHPFVLLIRDVASGTLLFLARVTDPSTG